MHGSFAGLACVEGTQNEHELYDVDIDEDQYTRTIMQPEGNIIKVLDAIDDDGYRFLGFNLATGWQGCRPETGGWMVAKRCMGLRW